MAPIFRPVHEMLDMDPKGRESLQDQLSRTLSKKDSDAYKDLSTEVGQRVHEAVHGRGWMTKAARTARIADPFYVGRTVSPYGAVVAVALELAWQAPPIATILTSMMAVGLFFVCNPHNILSRWIAWPTRIMIGIDSAFLIMSIALINPYLIAAAIVWTAFTAFLFWNMNSRWLFAQNMIMSDTVRLAITQCDDTKGLERWYDCGIKETRKALSEAGLPFDDQVLEIFALLVWLCGYYNHHIQISKKDAEIEKLGKQIQKLEFHAKIDEETIAELQSAIEKSEDSSDLDIFRNRVKDLFIKLSESKKREDALRVRVEELESELSSQLEISPEEQLKQLIFQLREPDEDGNQMSIREIKAELEARGITVSNGKIGAICKEYKEMHEEGEE